MKTTLRKTVKLIFGLFIFSIGVYLCIPANVGLAPWSAFAIGVSNATGMSFGNITVITSFVILAIDMLLKEKIGLGTVLDSLLVGNFVDLFQYLDWIPKIENFFLGVVVLLIGEVFICVGSYFYMEPGLGCGPRDSLMVAIGKRMPKVPIGVARFIIEGSALLVGWLLGAKVGIGTIIAVFGVSFILEYTFRLFKFDAKAIQHESIIATVKNCLPKQGSAAPSTKPDARDDGDAG